MPQPDLGSPSIAPVTGRPSWLNSATALANSSGSSLPGRPLVLTRTKNRIDVCALGTSSSAPVSGPTVALNRV